MFQWNVVSDILELAKKKTQYQDVILVCKNGKMTFNSLVLSSLSPVFQNALCSLSNNDLEEMITIMCLDVDIQDLKQFLNNILNQKEEIPSVDLLGLRTHEVWVKNDFDLQDQLTVEGSFCINDVNELEDISQKSPKHLHDFEDMNELIDSLDPLPMENDAESDFEEKEVKEATIVNFVKKPRERKYHFFCELCPFKAVRQDQLETHIRSKHTKKQKQTIFYCEICAFKTNRPDCLKKHVTNKHYEVNGLKKCKRCKALIVKEKFEEHSCKMFPCEVCGKEFGNLHLLADHVKREHEGRKKEFSACEVCGKVVVASSMKRHLDTHFDLKIPCPECGKECKSEGVLKDHLRSHREKEKERGKTLCTICNKEVLRYREHIETMHTKDEDKKFQCKHCGKGFNIEYKLKAHEMSVHIKARPFKCRYGCTFAYNDSSNRNAHERKTHGKLFDAKDQ